MNICQIEIDTEKETGRLRKKNYSVYVKLVTRPKKKTKQRKGKKFDLQVVPIYF